MWHTHITRSQQPLLRKKTGIWGFPGKQLNWLPGRPLQGEATGLVVDNVGVTSKSPPSPQLASMTLLGRAALALLFQTENQKYLRMYVPLPTVPPHAQGLYPMTDRYGVCTANPTDSSGDSPEATSYQSFPTLVPLRSYPVWLPLPSLPSLLWEHLLNKAVPAHTSPLFSVCSGEPNLRPLQTLPTNTDAWPSLVSQP